jgi:hypothetical protein
MFADRPMTSATGAITEDSAVARLPRAEGVTGPSGIRAAGVQLNTPSLAGTSSLSPSACEAFLGWILRPFLIPLKKFWPDFFSAVLHYVKKFITR